MNVLLAATDYTPEIAYDATEKTLRFRGVCAPVDTRKFFDEADYIIATDIDATNSVSRVQFHLEYFNTSSTRRLLEYILPGFKPKHFADDLVIEWIYEKEDSDLLEEGMLLQDLSGLAFTFVPR